MKNGNFAVPAQLTTRPTYDPKPRTVTTYVRVCHKATRQSFVPCAAKAVKIDKIKAAYELCLRVATGNMTEAVACRTQISLKECGKSLCIEALHSLCVKKSNIEKSTPA